MKTETKSPIERIFPQLAKHPYLSVVTMCLLLFFFGYCQKINLTVGSYIYAGIVAAVIFAVLFFLGKIGKDLKENAILFTFSVILSSGALYLIYSTENSTALMLWLFLAIIALLALVLHAVNSLNTRTFIMLMIAACIVLRYIYILYTDSLTRQHDVGYFNWTWGHANYIEYWYQNGLKLPDFDVRTKFQYYQPPLHHMLMGLLLKILTLFGMQYDTACQALQLLPFMYSSLITVVGYRIFRFVRLKGFALAVCMAVLCFHPTFVLMGGSFNNDLLSVFLMLCSVMFALRWYREPKLLKIIPVALCVGLSMMAKLSGWMAAPAIAILFLYVFVKNIKSWYKYLGQYAVFGVICAPLGLWWQVRNYILFKMPLTYVPVPASPEHPQYCGDMSVFERLFNFSGGQLTYVYDALTELGGPYDEFNPTLGLFKTALFDECTNSISDVNFPQITVTGPILFWIGAVLGILCFVSFVIMMIRKDSGLSGVERVFFSILAGTMIITYYLYGFKFPYTCSMNIRFCAGLIPTMILGLGLMLKRFADTDSTRGKIIRYTAFGLTAAFCIMVCVIYTQVG